MASSPPSPDGRHLVLVGMMGAGKSTVGRAAARRLGRPFLDSDAEIEARTGRTVRQIFERDGEPAFRRLESEVLADALASKAPAVIAAAGGVVLDATNRRLLHDGGTVVWLRADPATLVDRVRNGVHRPLLAEDPAGVLDRLATEREDLYREVAHRIVDVDGRRPDEVLDDVLDALGASA